ncbi:MAG: S66 peptidase family protein [Candidatus Moraniibacteriota bacterium]
MILQKLKPDDTVAIISPSWGGPSVFPHVYENGLKILTEWGLKIKEYPTARADAQYLRKNPEFRAKDINDAFSDREVKAIFTSIGGDDSVRILPYLDKKIIKNNPKILMGFSDTTTLHTFCNQLGLITFYGPSIMAGFSQMKNLPESFERHVKEMLFDPKDSYEYAPYGEYAEGYLGWSDKNIVGKTNELKRENDDWKFLQGSGIARGELFGGCIEVLEMMKGTEFWPKPEFWEGKILILETSEDKPTYSQVGWMLLNYGMQGVFDRISGLVFGRARNYSQEEKLELEKKIIAVVRDEFGRADLPIIANMDFGHTDPQFVLPLGAKAEIDCENKKFAIVEPWLA